MSALPLALALVAAGPASAPAAKGPAPGYQWDIAGKGPPDLVQRLPKALANRAAGPERCRDLCYRELACHSFVYRPRDAGGPARCELFRVPPVSIPVPGAAAGALVAYPLKTTGRRLGLEPDRVREGPAIPGVPPTEPTAEGCREACARTSQCRAFAFHPPAPLPEGEVGPPAPVCRRMKTVERRAKAPGVTSGEAAEVRLRVMIDGGVRRPGPAYRALEIPRRLPDDCRMACVRDARCVAFQYVAPTAPGAPGQCSLRNELTSAREKASGHLYGVIGEAGGSGAKPPKK